MTERALLIKSATSSDGRYYAVGLGSPHVRIFDTARGALCAHVDLVEKMASDKRAGLQSAIRESVATTYHDRTQELAAIRDVTLTAVHIAALGGSSSLGKVQRGTAGDVDEMTQICVAGFSNGTIMAVRLADDTVLYHVAVSDTQQAAVAFASTSEYLFVLCANRQLHVIEAATGTRLVLGIPVAANTSTLAVYAPPPSVAAGAQPGGGGWVDVLLCGASTLYCSLHVPSHRSYSAMNLKMPSLGGSSTPTTHAFIGSTLSKGAGPTNIGITCAASEGVVRVWDLSPNAASGQSAGSRCRRILPCNHRVASMSVLPERGVISVVTFAGQILLWEFLNADGHTSAQGQSAIIARAGDAYAQPANVAITSTIVPSHNRSRYQKAQQLYKGVVRGVPTSKIVTACLVPNPTHKGTSAAGASCSLVIIRGKLALPKFDGVSLAPVFGSNLLGIDHNARESVAIGSSDPEHHLYITAPGVTIAGNATLGPNLSFDPHEGVVATISNTAAHNDEDEQDEDDENALAQFELKIGAGWATHSAEAHRAMVTATEEFAKPTIFHAASMKELPTVGALSSKEADKAMERALGKKAGALTTSARDQGEEEAVDETQGDADAEGEAAPSGKRSGKRGGRQQLGALGLAVVPLYQALHANDKALTMELITLASRSQADVVATVRRLELPYVLQLFHILSERLISLNQMDHPFHTWVAAILQARGVEMLSEKNNEFLKSQGCSTPKQFIAPLRNSYDSMLEMQDRLAVLYGRLSIFNAVKPRTDSIKRKTHATIRKGTVGADPTIFPNCFKEVVEKNRKNKATRRPTHTVTRVSAEALSQGRATTQIREERRNARKAEQKRKTAIANEDDDNAAGDAQDDVFDEADEDEMMEHLGDMTLDDSDDEGEEVEGSDDEDGSIIADDDAADDDRDSEESSADEADNLLDSEDELGLEEDEDEEDYDAEEDDEDEDEDDEDGDFGGNDEGEDDDEDDDDDNDEADDVDEEIRHEHDKSHQTAKSVDEKRRNRRIRTD